MFNIGPFEIVLLAIVGLLLFGRRLPEVGKNLAKGIVEFKKGLSGVEDDVNRAGAATPPQQPNLLHQSAAQIQPNQNPAATAVNQNTNAASPNQQ